MASRSRFSVEIFSFLKNEVQLFLARESGLAPARQLLSRFEAICIDAAEFGFEVSHADSSMDVYVRQRTAESAAHAVRSVLFHAIRERTGEIIRFSIPNGRDVRFSDIVFRLTSPQIVTSSFNEARFFPGLEAPESDFFGISIVGADFSFSNFENSNFSWGHLQFVDFGNCNLKESRFLRCNMMDCYFEDSQLDKTFFHYSFLDNTDVFLNTEGRVHMNAATFGMLDRHTFAKISEGEVPHSRISYSGFLSEDSTEKIVDQATYFSENFPYKGQTPED